MSEISDLVSVVVTEESAAVTQQGFGTPMLMSCEAHAVFTEAARIYTDPADMVTDGFDAGGMTVLGAEAVFAQSPNPGQIVIGRRANLPTRIVVLTPIVKNSTEYSVTIDGTTFSATSDSTATAAEIVTALTTAINAGSVPVTASGTSTLILTADAAGHMFTLEVNRQLLTQSETTVDGGVVADLNTIRSSLDGNDDWYMALTDSKGKAEILLLAAAINAIDRMFIFSSADDACIAAGNTDVIGSCFVANYRRVAGVYHPKPHQNCDCAWAGSRLAYTPGSETWMYANLSGVDTVKLTNTEKATLVGKLGNYYRSAAGRSFMHGGTVAGNDFIDNVRGVDWTTARIAEAVFGLLVSKTKVPMTNKGISAVQSQVKSVLQAGVTNGLFTDETPNQPTVTVPKVADLSDADRAARKLNGVKFTAMFANAIHYVGVTGVIQI